jgi:hypothetical protein
MPQIIGVQEAIKLDVDDTITGVKGKVKSVFDQNSGESDKGEWTRQGVIISDLKAPKASIMLNIWNKDEIPDSLKGKTVYIYAGKKGAGLTRKEYKGKPQIDVTQAATISTKDPAQSGGGEGEAEPAGEEPNGEAEPSEEQEQPAKGKEKQAAAPPVEKDDKKRFLQLVQEMNGLSKAISPGTKPHAEVDPVGFVIEAKRFLARRGNAMRLCGDETLRIVEGYAKEHGLPWTPESKAATAQLIAENLCQRVYTTLFIAMNDAGMVDLMPYGDLDSLMSFAKQRLEARAAAVEAKKSAE